MTVHLAGQTIHNRDILLDGGTITDSKLIGCRIIHRGGRFRWQNSEAVNCEFVFEENAAFTLDLLFILGVVDDRFMREHVTMPLDH